VVSHSWVQGLGITLVAAGVVAIDGAALTLITLNRPTPTARLLAVVGGAMLLGVTLTAITTVLRKVGTTVVENAHVLSLTTEFGIAFWLAIVIAVTGIGAVVLTMLSGGDTADARAGSIGGATSSQRQPGPQLGHQFAVQTGPHLPQSYPGPPVPPAQPPHTPH
jgi:hypothetical protein